MNIQELLQQTGAVGAISRDLGVDQATAEKGASALLPSVLSGFQNPQSAPQGQGAACSARAAAASAG